VTERQELAIKNVSDFASFAVGKLPPHIVEDLLIVTSLAREASGIETEGHDGATRHGAKHESPTPKGDAQ
jgi:hypothetical protein